MERSIQENKLATAKGETASIIRWVFLRGREKGVFRIQWGGEGDFVGGCLKKEDSYSEEKEGVRGCLIKTQKGTLWHAGCEGEKRDNAKVIWQRCLPLVYGGMQLYAAPGKGVRLRRGLDGTFVAKRGGGRGTMANLNENKSCEEREQIKKTPY